MASFQGFIFGGIGHRYSWRSGSQRHGLHAAMSAGPWTNFARPWLHVNLSYRNGVPVYTVQISDAHDNGLGRVVAQGILVLGAPLPPGVTEAQHAVRST